MQCSEDERLDEKLWRMPMRGGGACCHCCLEIFRSGVTIVERCACTYNGDVRGGLSLRILIRMNVLHARRSLRNQDYVQQPNI